MSDEAKMPDPKVEAEDWMITFICPGHAEATCEHFEEGLRSLMARTLRAAASQFDHSAAKFSPSEARSAVEVAAADPKRMASEIENGK